MKFTHITHKFFLLLLAKHSRDHLQDWRAVHIPPWSQFKSTLTHPPSHTLKLLKLSSWHVNSRADQSSSLYDLYLTYSKTPYSQRGRVFLDLCIPEENQES